MKSRVFVGGIPQETRERDLERFFKGFGHITEILIKNGYAFVEFEEKRDADDAIYDLDGSKLLGQEVSIQRARGIDRTATRDRRVDRRNYQRYSRYGAPERTRYRIIVQNLASSVSWQDLKDFMRRAGEVTYGEAHRSIRNEGIIDFASYSGMKRALERLDDTELNGRRIRLREARVSRSRSRSGRSGTRSISRSRSPRRSISRSRSPRRSISRSRSTSRSKSLSPLRRSRMLSRSRSASRSRSRSVMRSKSRSSRSKSRSKSRSASRSKSRSRSRSAIRSKSRSKSRSVSRSKSRSRSRSAIRSKSRSKPRSVSRSKSRSKSRSASRSKSRDLSSEKRNSRKKFGSKSPFN